MENLYVSDMRRPIPPPPPPANLKIFLTLKIFSHDTWNFTRYV